MNTPESATFTRRVKDASSIVEVISGHVQLSPCGPVLTGLCPFCLKGLIVVDPKWQNYRCDDCAKIGDVFTFVQAANGVGFAEARLLLAEQTGVKAP